MRLILTCEHGGNHIPKGYDPYFRNARSALNSHRGYDLGALDLFKVLVPLSDYWTSSETSRLLVELNRSLHHPQLFSEYTKGLSIHQKKELLEEHYYPYRNVVESRIAETLEKGEEVLHISIHSFTPELKGEVRKTDIGLLFDPSRSGEKEFCKRFRKKMKGIQPELVVRFNYPYLGIADGFPTYLRKIFPKGYNGIELEVNQKFVNGRNCIQNGVKDAIFMALRN